MIPLVGVTGWHRTGKTTFIVALINALSARGVSVATIKHTSEAIAMDKEGTDTFLFSKAGSRFVAIVGPQGSAILLPTPPEPSFWELAAMVPPDTGLVIVEGYRKLAMPRFEILTEGYPETVPDSLVAAVYRDLAKVPSDLPKNICVLQARDTERAVELLYDRGILTKR
ncbi:MAG: molybdopterin-guanine dinucleotide biosynthesis protein B [Anaerolineae bacterium]